MIESIEGREEATFNTVLAKYMNLTPFDKVKTQLIVKIKEIYLPPQGSNVAVGQSSSHLDFTGGSESTVGTTYGSKSGGGGSRQQNNDLDFT